MRALVLLRLEDSAGRVGFGEAAPLPDYDGVSIDDVRRGARGLPATLLARGRRLGREELLAAVPADRGAAAGGRGDRPGAVGPRGPARPDSRVAAARRPRRRRGRGQRHDRRRATAPAPPPRRGAAKAAGFRCVKAKVGIGDDAGRLAAVRAVLGPDVAIRLDANGAWSVDEALAVAAGARAGRDRAVRGARPRASTQTPALAAATRVPIALDETAGALGALDRRVCEAVCLKIARCGGITGVIEAARQARAAGYEVYLASTLDGPLGIAAALHAAALVRPDRAVRARDAGSVRRPRGSAAGARRVGSTVPVGPGLGDGLHLLVQPADSALM